MTSISLQRYLNLIEKIKNLHLIEQIILNYCPPDSALGSLEDEDSSYGSIQQQNIDKSYNTIVKGTLGNFFGLKLKS